MDCSDTCFGKAFEDTCGICDENMDNDNSSCSGCIDVNAENYDETAVFGDGSCEYSDNIFQVPLEYSSIQSAINFARNGDIVEVGTGTYFENIDFQGTSVGQTWPISFTFPETLMSSWSFRGLYMDYQLLEKKDISLKETVSF